MWRDATAGVRMTTALQWPLAGVVGTFDLYPAYGDNDPRFFEATVMARIGL